MVFEVVYQFRLIDYFFKLKLVRHSHLMSPNCRIKEKPGNKQTYTGIGFKVSVDLLKTDLISFDVRSF